MMRVSTIAQEAIARGHECHFVGTTTELSWVDSYVRNLGFKSFNQEIDSLGADFTDSILVLDSYTIDLDSPYIRADIWKLIVSITDQFTPNYSADIYVNQGMQVKSAADNVSVLEGPDFALIRKTIKKNSERVRFEFPPKILITGGGSDPFGFVKAVLQQLSYSGSNFEAHVFSDENLGSLQPMNVRQHPVGEKLDEIAQRVDLAITTASTSSIEFIAREIPTLVGCAVDNQENLYSELGESGFVIPIGKRNVDGQWQLDFQTLKRAIEVPEIRSNLRNRIRGVIDLKGPSRVLDHIELKLTLAGREPE